MKRISCFIGSVIVLMLIVSFSDNVALANEKPVCAICGNTLVEGKPPHIRVENDENEENREIFIIFCSQECADKYVKGTQGNTQDEEE